MLRSMVLIQSTSIFVSSCCVHFHACFKKKKKKLTFFLGGHSAGAQLISLLAFHKKHLREVGLSSRQIKGLICVSGCFNIPRMYSIPFVSRLFCVPVFGHDPNTHRDASPLFNITPSHHLATYHHDQFRVLLINAESDFYLHRDAREMRDALKSSGIDVMTELITGKNHRSIMYTRDLVASKVDRFIQSYSHHPLPKRASISAELIRSSNTTPPSGSTTTTTSSLSNTTSCRPSSVHMRSVLSSADLVPIRVWIPYLCFYLLFINEKERKNENLRELLLQSWSKIE